MVRSIVHLTKGIVIEIEKFARFARERVIKVVVCPVFIRVSCMNRFLAKKKSAESGKTFSDAAMRGYHRKCHLRITTKIPTSVSA